MKIRICIFIYSRRINRCNFIQFFYWYYITWYLLCSSSLSLCFIYRGCICYFRGIYSLISFIYRIIFKSIYIKNSIFYYIYWCKFNLFPSTFLRFSWNTSSLFRLSRLLYFMKCYLIIRILYFIISNHIYINYYLRVNN